MNKNDKYIDGIRPKSTRSSSAGRRSASTASSRRIGVTQPANSIGFDREKVRAAASSKEMQRERKEFLKPIEAFDLDLDSDDLNYKRQKVKSGAPGVLGAKARHPKKKKWSTKRKVITTILLALVAVVIGVLIWGNDIIAKLTNGNSNLFDAISSIVTETVPPLKTDQNGRANILLFGTSGYEMEGSGHDGAQLTDSIMLFSIDQNANDAAMVSIPRDLYVGTCTSTGKVNEVYWCANPNGNNETAGAEAIMTSMENITGQDIQYFAHVDWGALIQVVDSIGGITVTLDEDIEDSWTKTYIRAGVPVALDGEQALGLARARHGTTNGDFTRGASQQKILIAIQEKIVQNGLDFGQILSLVNVLGDNLRTNFTTDDFKSLFNTLKDFSMQNLRQVPLLGTADGNYMTTGTINGISYVLPSAGRGNYSQLQQYIASQFTSDPLKRENATIVVLNGSGEVGAASTERAALESLGYNVINVGDAPDGAWTERYYLYDTSEGDKTGTLHALAEHYNIGAQGINSLPAGINTYGIDFIIVVGQQPENQ